MTSAIRSLLSVAAVALLASGVAATASTRDLPFPPPKGEVATVADLPFPPPKGEAATVADLPFPPPKGELATMA